MESVSVKMDFSQMEFEMNAFHAKLDAKNVLLWKNAKSVIYQITFYLKMVNVAAKKECILTKPLISVKNVIIAA